ncbi:hypothetical protein PMAYCL1PPCAC_09481, partial [Pristionchus mayeri]
SFVSRVLHNSHCAQLPSRPPRPSWPNPQLIYSDRFPIQSPNLLVAQTQSISVALHSVRCLSLLSGKKSSHYVVAFADARFCWQRP